jgi:hypothetical protein
VAQRDGKVLAHLNKEETFGEISYLGRTSSPHSVVATAKASVREIPAAFLDKLFSNSPGACVYLYVNASCDLRYACSLGVARVQVSGGGVGDEATHIARTAACR